MITKICTICRIEFPATTDYFFREKCGKYGLRSKCKKCFQEESLKYKQSPEAMEKAKIAGRKHYAENKEKYAARWQEYYKDNAEHLREKAREWGKNNLDKRRIADAKRREDVGYRLSSNISRSIRQSLFRFDGKGGAPWETLVNFTLDDLKKHLEEQFVEGMTWENYGEWHIDHKIPIAVHNFTKPEHEDFKKCWSLDNLQPMWAKENISKGAKIEKPFQMALAI